MRRETSRPRRPLAINWDDFEIALTWRSDELKYFLDLHTGEVRQWRRFPFADGAEDFELTEDEADEELLVVTSRPSRKPSGGSIEEAVVNEAKGRARRGRSCVGSRAAQKR